MFRLKQHFMEDHLLVLQIQQSNTKAFKTIYDRYYKLLVLFCKQYVDDLSTAEDMVQDVFVNIYENRKTLSITTSFKSFLYTSVKNKALNHTKRSKKMVLNNYETNNNILLTEEDTIAIEQLELSKKLHRAISRLPKKNQEIFKMSRFKGYTNQEIAELMQLSIRTVETHISNSIKELKNTLNPILIFFLKLF